MSNERVPDEVKIIHIHRGKDEQSNFVEFIKLRDGKTGILRTGGFIKRFGKELIEAFEAIENK